MIKLFILYCIVALFNSELTKFVDQVRIKLFSQLTKGISIVLQKLLKYLNSTATAAFAIPSLWALSNNLYLNLNDAKLVTGLSL